MLVIKMGDHCDVQLLGTDIILRGEVNPEGRRARGSGRVHDQIGLSTLEIQLRIYHIVVETPADDLNPWHRGQIQYTRTRATDLKHHPVLGLSVYDLLDIRRGQYIWRSRGNPMAVIELYQIPRPIHWHSTEYMLLTLSVQWLGSMHNFHIIFQVIRIRVSVKREQ